MAEQVATKKDVLANLPQMWKAFTDLTFKIDMTHDRAACPNWSPRHGSEQRR